MKKTLLMLVLAAFTANAALAVSEPSASTPVKKSVVKKKASKKRHHKRVRHAQEYRAPTPLRTLSVNTESAWDQSTLELKSAAAIVVNQETGEALYAKNIEVPTAIASITKLMTAMVTLDAELPMDEVITISEEDIDRLKGTHSKLTLGARVTRDELLHLALIASDNRAAAALSRAYPGGRGAFVMAMNAKASELGMEHTHFVDGTGLYSSNRSTAVDLVKMVDAASQYPLLHQITSSGSYDIDLPSKRIVRIREHGHLKRVARESTHRVTVNNTNALTRSDEWEIGLSKTGYINEAGRCLVMQAKIAQRKVIIVLLDSWGKWTRLGDANRIKKWLEHNDRFAKRASREAA